MRATKLSPLCFALALAVVLPLSLPERVEAAECESGTRAPEVRIQLWRDRHCGGPWIGVLVGRDGDRPDFVRFRHADGDAYDVDGNRSSIALAPGSCVRLFAEPGYGGTATRRLCARERSAYYSLPDGLSSMRACTRETLELCGRAPEATPDPPMTRAIERFTFDRTGLYPGDCSGRALPGTIALRTLIARRWRTGHTRLLYSCVRARPDSPRVDIHGEGRALDWTLHAGSPRDRAIGDAIVDYLLATDDEGRLCERARRLGVQEIVWNGQIWQAHRRRIGLRPYNGLDPRTTHIHIGLTRAGAAKETSWWQ